MEDKGNGTTAEGFYVMALQKVGCCHPSLIKFLGVAVAFPQKELVQDIEQLQ